MAPSPKLKLLQGSASNLLRILLSMVVSLLLPPFLVHRMAPAEYSAWVLILQLSAYVTYLDFGLQTAIGKYVAEYDATGDRDSARRMISTAFSLLSIASMTGFILVAVLSYRVPHLFQQMPPSLLPDVRLGLLSVGLSVCITLPLTVFATTFAGLQEYGIITVIQIAGRVLSALALVAIILERGTLLQMAWVMAATNIATGISQVIGWKHYASHRVPFSFLFFDKRWFRTLAEYCGVLSIWNVGLLLISGLDTTIVGHFDYHNTGYYAVAASATNFMLIVTSNMLSPLLPAISSLQTSRSAEEMGNLLVQATRIGFVSLIFFGLPLLVGGYPLLTLWLGSGYAVRSVAFLEIMVVANILRQLGFPYALFIVALGKQRYATVSPIAESILNITLSILLARRYGAIGVALGTLIAAFVGLGAHLLISMHRTQSAISVRRATLLSQGILRPAICILPTIAILPFWRRQSLWPAEPGIVIAWVLATAVLIWFVGLSHKERDQLLSQLRRRFGQLVY